MQSKKKLRVFTPQQLFRNILVDLYIIQVLGVRKIDKKNVVWWKVSTSHPNHQHLHHYRQWLNSLLLFSNITTDIIIIITTFSDLPFQVFSITHYKENFNSIIQFLLHKEVLMKDIIITKGKYLKLDNNEWFYVRMLVYLLTVICIWPLWVHLKYIRRWNIVAPHSNSLLQHWSRFIWNYLKYLLLLFNFNEQRFMTVLLKNQM